MTIPSVAAGAYANIARLADPSAGLGKAAGAAGEAASGPSFGAMLKDALNSVTEAGHKSDAQTQAMVAGKSDMVDVVTAVSETEVAVETMVAVRNKVIEAYQGHHVDANLMVFAGAFAGKCPPRQRVRPKAGPMISSGGGGFWFFVRKCDNART